MPCAVTSPGSLIPCSKSPRLSHQPLREPSLLKWHQMRLLLAALNQKELTALIIYESSGFIQQSPLPAESHSFSSKYGIAKCGHGKMKLVLGKKTQRLKKNFHGKSRIYITYVIPL